MKIIADSGSTKTHWVIVSNDGEQSSLFSQGLNPYFVDSKDIEQIVKIAFKDFDCKQVSGLIFYGAGCSLADKCTLIHGAFSAVFINADIQVHSDLLAAARALFADTAGVACILGTGSNATVYDGEAFLDRIKSMGYLIGDEGSGSYIGKQILQSYLRGLMPEDLKKAFESTYKIEIPKLLDRLYKQAFPNRYLASFAAFASDHAQHGFIRNIVRSSFQDFIQFQLKTLRFKIELPIGFVGSVAYYFQDILKDELEASAFVCGHIIKEPIHNLVKYHLEVPL